MRNPFLMNRDYEMLEDVRTMWPNYKVQLFLGCLFEIWSIRTKEPSLLFLQYIPGDYITAAEKAKVLR